MRGFVKLSHTGSTHRKCYKQSEVLIKSALFISVAYDLSLKSWPCKSQKNEYQYQAQNSCKSPGWLPKVYTESWCTHDLVNKKYIKKETQKSEGTH